MQLEGATFDQGVFQGMKDGSKAMQQIQEKMNIDEMDKIKDDIMDQLDRQEEINEFFAENAKKDRDELEAELEEMMAMEQMDELDVGSGAIAAKEKQQPLKPLKPVQKVEEDEEEELAKMMAL